jgi:hypothetical protein
MILELVYKFIWVTPVAPKISAGGVNDTKEQPIVVPTFITDILERKPTDSVGMSFGSCEVKRNEEAEGKLLEKLEPAVRIELTTC